MVTLTTADNALKTFYLDAVTKEIDEKGSPFFSMIEKNSANVVGKSVSKVIKTGLSGGLGAGTEDGMLPKGENGKYITLTAPLKNLYGTIEITDKALRASANNEGAFVDLLNDEMQTLVQSAKYNFSRMLFGDGTGVLATLEDVNSHKFIVNSTVYLEEGMYVDIWFEGTKIQDGVKIKSVNHKAKEVAFDIDTTISSGWEIGSEVLMHGAEFDCELTGLGALFSRLKFYEGKNSAYMTPYVEKNVGDINEEIVQKVMDEVERASGSSVDLIICSWGVRRALMKACKENNYPLTMVKFGDNASALSINGVPVVVDRFCQEDRMYLLNTKDFKLCQLCDWQWMEGEDGKILKQVAGKPVYTATLVKYAELICQKPCGQAMITGINVQ